MIKLSFLYCEGLHDVAFLAKLIEVLELTNGEVKKVSALPDLLKSMVESAVKDINTNNIRFGLPLTVFMPNKIYSLTGEHYVCLFATGGKTSLQAALNNIAKSKKLLKKPTFYNVDQIRHAFVLDADYEDMDDGGLDTTLNGLSASIKSVVTDFQSFDQKIQWRSTAEHGEIGTFIFTNESNTEGTLEDLLDTFINIEELMEPATSFKESIIEFDRIKQRSTKDTAKQQKIIFTNLTQAFHPGSSLAVGLARGNLINTEIMASHELSAEFGNFIKLSE
ncbi:DUF3226 domain-containing protein [Vibrio sp. 624788]|uniref:DUF3226 domain-containing protein n=1 Tax=Vibrio sp. 624788 TaxID=1234362 RepID=UPI0002E69371|nr:DUF3226 domain-containing protein [Vibrio sp. 624788]